eukprot:GDKI01003103.1.p1 GENE.GDKI01003103.1~~GDKI01003103.1.p1  ORF type:complete len:249 (+),score=59.24 GDKI01003103.1:215-961(+)
MNTPIVPVLSSSPLPLFLPLFILILLAPVVLSFFSFIALYMGFAPTLLPTFTFLLPKLTHNTHTNTITHTHTSPITICVSPPSSTVSFEEEKRTHICSLPRAVSFVSVCSTADVSRRASIEFETPRGDRDAYMRDAVCRLWARHQFQSAVEKQKRIPSFSDVSTCAAECASLSDQDDLETPKHEETEIISIDQETPVESDSFLFSPVRRMCVAHREIDNGDMDCVSPCSTFSVDWDETDRLRLLLDVE